jgi:hypothetical protein
MDPISEIAGIARDKLSAPATMDNLFPIAEAVVV